MKDAADAILQTEQASYLDALLGAPRDALLARMETRAAERGYPISDPEVATFLAISATIARPRFIVEVGANIGYGAIVLARAAPSAKVLTIEYDADLCAEARAFIAEAGLASRIEVRHGKAIPELETIDQPIDLAYIDCVKEEYVRYLEIIEARMPVGGVVVADNVMWKGLVARFDPRTVPEKERIRTEALRAFNVALVGHPKYHATVLPFGDGVAYAVKVG